MHIISKCAAHKTIDDYSPHNMDFSGHQWCSQMPHSYQQAGTQLTASIAWDQYSQYLWTVVKSKLQDHWFSLVRIVIRPEKDEVDSGRQVHQLGWYKPSKIHFVSSVTFYGERGLIFALQQVRGTKRNTSSQHKIFWNLFLHFPILPSAQIDTTEERES